MEKVNKHIITQSLKGIFAAIVISIIAILLLAIIISYTSLTQNIVDGIVQGIKIISIFIACLLSVRNNAGLVKGVFIGLIYIILSFLCFSLLSKELTFNLMDGIDILTGVVSGALSGVITLFLRK